jgi:hypothetical protein
VVRDRAEPTADGGDRHVAVHIRPQHRHAQPAHLSQQQR